MPFQKLIQFLYTWEVRLCVILSLSIQTTLFVFGSRRKISRATWLRILVWCAYVSADAMAIFSLGLLARDKEELYKNERLLNRQLHLLWVPFMILHLGGPDTITAYSLEDNNLWLRHFLNLVIQIGVALYAIIISWNKPNPLSYLVIPIFVSGAIKYCERTWALKSASFEQVFLRWSLEKEHIYGRWSEKTETGTCFSECYEFLIVMACFFAEESLPNAERTTNHGWIILNKTSSDAFRLVEEELGLMYDLLYTKASLIYSRLGICLRCLYLVSSVATLITFVIIHKHKHNESTWAYPLSDVLVTYFLMIGAVILEIYATILVVLSDWTLIWLDKHQNNNNFAKFLFQKISMHRGVLLSDKRWSRSLKQHFFHPRPTTFKRIKDWFFIHYPFPSLVTDRWKRKALAFDMISEASDDAQQTMREGVWEVIKNWLRHSDRQPEKMTFSEFMSESDLSGLWKSTAKDGSEEFGESLFLWYDVTYLLLKKSGDNIKKPIPIGSGSHSPSLHYDYKARSKYLSGYLMYLAWFREDMLPPAGYKRLRWGIEQMSPGPFHPEGIKNMPSPPEVKEPSIGRADVDLFEMLIDMPHGPVKRIADWLANHFDEMPDGDKNKWEYISSVWARMLVYAAASRSKWVEHAQQLRRGGEFLTHVAVLFAHASLMYHAE